MVVAQVAYCGFSVWIFVDATFPILYLLAWAVALAIVGLAKRMGAWAALAVPLLYPLCGTPALMGGVLAMLLPGQSRLVRGVYLLPVVLAPLLWHLLSPYDPAWGPLLCANVPALFERGSFVWDSASLVLFVALALAPYRPLSGWTAAVMQRVPPRWEHLAGWGVKCLPALLFVLLAVWVADPKQPLYDLLACERALARDDMERILAVPKERVASHRMLAAYYIHALWRSGYLEERLFDVPWTVSHDASTIDTMELDGYNLIYHYGIVQLARRWCYESVINKGWSPAKLGLMARVALVCNEGALARRYALQLRRIPLYRREAEVLLELAEGRGEPDRNLLRVADLHRRLCLDSGGPTFEGDKRLEAGIYNRYAVLKNGNREMVSLYLCVSMLRKDLVPLLENFDVILTVWPKRPLPRAFQQGLLAAAATVPPEQQPRLTADLFSPGVPQAFAAYRERSSKTSPYDEVFYQRFGKTYWFYATFVP